MANGENSGTWGTNTNTNWSLIEQAVAGVVTITMANADYTLTVYNGVSDESRNMIILATGANTAIRKIVAPLVPKIYTIANKTTGGYDITIGGATGAVATIPFGTTAQVYCDGSAFYSALNGVGGDLTSSGYVISTSSGGYSALQSNSVTVGNSTTGMNYSGGQLNWQISNTTLASLQSSGALYATSFVPTTGILGVTSGSSGTAGYVGELLKSEALTQVGITSGTTKTVTTLTLTPGDWMVTSIASAYAVGGSFVSFITEVNTSSSFGSYPSVGFFENAAITAISQPYTINYNVSSNTTIYLLTQITGGTGTLTTNGAVYARRMR
jgi:hypothetical protein